MGLINKDIKQIINRILIVNRIKQYNEQYRKLFIIDPTGRLRFMHGMRYGIMLNWRNLNDHSNYNTAIFNIFKITILSHIKLSHNY